MKDKGNKQFQTDQPSHQPSSEEPRGGLGSVGRLSKINKRLIFFGALAILALILFTIAFMGSFVDFAHAIMDVISPLIIGGVIAYLCNPIFEFFEYRVFRKMAKGNARRGLSLALTIITFFAIIILVAIMMIPELVASIKELISDSSGFTTRFLGYLQGIIDKLHINIDISSSEKLTELITSLFGSMNELFQDLLNFFSKSDAMGSVIDIFIQVFNAFKNLIIGLFIAFYLLGSKEKRVAQLRKFRAAMLTEEQDSKLKEFVELTDHCFGGFIFGKILDSLVIGILTFALMTIFQVSKYNLLIATFIGITNIIPVFGPFIGAIPSAFIILVDDPSKFFFFLLLILIVQQLDGNIIGPKILGDNTGVSSLCVIIAICTCGTIWGIPGMIIGVPIFAVIIEWVKRILENRLREKNKPTDTLAYYPSDAIGNAEQDLYYEHSGLRYQYEHSRLKPKVDRMKKKVFRSLDRNTPTTPTPTKADPAPKDETTDDSENKPKA